MQIILKKLTLTNFKGIRSFSTTFNHVTDIFGDNATGKTTLKDAFLWLFFGKDSSDRKDFEIKTLDADNNPYHNLDHEVEAIVSVDGEDLNIRKSFREKWVKKRGEQTPVFSGHENLFFWNDVPLKEGEFQAKVASVFNENIFKLITNTDYFNSLKWQDRRGVLMQIAGKIDDADILKAIGGASGENAELAKALGQKKTIEEFRKEINAKKKKIKDELDLIPSRIDEANRALPEDKDYSAIDKMIAEATADLQTVENLLSNKSAAAKEHQNNMLGKQKEVGTLRQRLQQIEFDIKTKLTAKRIEREQVIVTKQDELRAKTNEKDRLLVQYNAEHKRIEGLIVLKNDLTGKWEAINSESLAFNEKDFCCPACKRPLEEGDIASKKEQLTANFNSDKARRIQDVADRGIKTKGEIEVIEKNIESIKQKGTLLASEMAILIDDIGILTEESRGLNERETEEIQRAIAADTEHKATSDMIRLREEEINTPFPEDDNSDLLSRKRSISVSIDEWKKQVSGKDQRERIVARIKELKDQEATMAQELATLEGTEFSIESFVKSKMDLLEQRINGLFKIVRFKMYEDQINGGRVEACTTLINGVPYSDANMAARIQAGLDIINTLSDHYGTYGPVWVDNRESVILLPETKSQLINLIVSADYKKLTVDTKKKLVAA